ncbi:hypothetical protein F5Y18DRAFT_431166 [Xylariaceae sp. FL1019]|nr:hypothetical protein F5Y18DRAFT_431166 [Xylariaceae sp. FL1019]
MAEVLGVVSATLGLLPVMVEVIRGFQGVRKGVSVAVKSTKELQSIKDALRIQETRFLNECELLLCLVVSCEEAHIIVSDTGHAKWTEEALTLKLEEILERSYSACNTVVAMMRDAQQEINTELRLSTSYVAFEKSRYEQMVDRLRKGNEDLESLKRQIYEFRSSSVRVPASTSSRKALPDSTKTVREMSKEVYGALIGSFSCGEAAHVEHAAALSIETEAGPNNALEMVISYLAKNESLGQGTTLRLSLRSHDNPYHNKGKRFASSEGAVKQRKKMRSLAPDDDTDEHESSAKQGSGFDSDPVNISSLENACLYLEQAYRRSSCQARLYQYLGYLQTSQRCRYIFYITPSIDSLAGNAPLLFNDDQSLTLQDLLVTSRAEDLTRSNQMRFALKAVMAVLKFHSTPWLNDSWRTSDLLITSPPPSAPRHSSFLLRSHLPSRDVIRNDSTLSKTVTAANQQEDTVMVAGVTECVTPDDRYGVYNKILWSLGAALLEIGHWETFDRLRGGGENDEHSDILAARRLSKRRTMLGGRYDEMVRKCLRCDFGQGDDLATRALEEAVYESIVCPLQESIGKMEELCI